MRIGLDFDNTLVSYDTLFVHGARERGWLDGHAQIVGQKAVRQKIRMLMDGELKWQTLQAWVYGPRMADAQLMDGVAKFLHEGVRRGVTFFIVSHKTQFATQDTIKRYDLRQLALAWMLAQGFFRSDGFAIPRQNVFFADSRQEKLARIAQLECTDFVDDLPEILLDPHFPVTTTRLLIDPHREANENSLYRIYPHWDAIYREIFGVKS